MLVLFAIALAVTLIPTSTSDCLDQGTTGYLHLPLRYDFTPPPETGTIVIIKSISALHYGGCL
jgi:hypothetical protein